MTFAFNWIINSTSPVAPQGLAGGVAKLTDGANVTLDASLGKMFFLDAFGDRTIDPPLNPGAGQAIVIIHYAHTSSRTLSLSTSAGGFRFGTDITGLTATDADKYDYIGCIYNYLSDKWDVVSYVKGH